MNNSLEKRIKWWRDNQFDFRVFFWTMMIPVLLGFLSFQLNDGSYNFKRDSLLSPIFAGPGAYDEYYLLQSEHYESFFKDRYACRVFFTPATSQFLTFTFDSVEEMYSFDYDLDGESQFMVCGLNNGKHVSHMRYE